jgi:hypothetical protein
LAGITTTSGLVGTQIQVLGELQQAPGAAGPYLKVAQAKAHFDDVHERRNQGHGPSCAGRGCTNLRSNFHLVLMQLRGGESISGEGFSRNA